MNSLNDFLLYDVFYFLPNEDIFKLNKINENCRKLVLDNIFYENILYREHPMVFNLVDNYCQLCNLQLYFITSKSKFKSISCKHLIFKDNKKLSH